MSFQLPHNVPAFTSSQRPYEDGYWRAANRGGHGLQQNGHTYANGIGSKINDLFSDGKELPLYKDKPSYSSRRPRGLLQRKRFLGGVVLLVLLMMWWTGILRAHKSIRAEVSKKGSVMWSWLGNSGANEVDWDARRERVKEAFILSWDAYERYAWGMDEYHPISKNGRHMVEGGMGWIIVDALDTLMLMNLTSRVQHAREWISTSLHYSQNHEVNTFETTIRMLGGLLSAHYLSTTFPSLAPLADDDTGKRGEDLYIEKAADLADRLLGAFESDSGIPYASVNLNTSRGVQSNGDGGASSTAEAASLQLEFKYLAKLTGEPNYWQVAEKVIKVIDDNGMEDGLLPIYVYATTGNFRGENVRLGSRGDSYYEYLIKQYLQTSKAEPLYLDMWNEAMAGIRKHLITYTTRTQLTVLGERPNGLHRELSPKMDHLVCFMPGTIALGATGGLPVLEAKKSSTWGKKQEEDVLLAKELMKTCWGMYLATATGLAPEITFFAIDDPPKMMTDMAKDRVKKKFAGAQGGTISKPLLPIDDPSAEWRKDYIIKPSDHHNLQRPETVESLFYMWRITGDEMYRRWGWEIFKSFVRHTAVDDGAGFTSLGNANTLPAEKRDNMESFWLAETLKYFYLLFSPQEFMPLEDIIINTEAHIFPRFEMKGALKTGWKRKQRDQDGKIIPEDKMERTEKGDGNDKREDKTKVVRVELQG